MNEAAFRPGIRKHAHRKNSLSRMLFDTRSALHILRFSLVSLPNKIGKTYSFFQEKGSKLAASKLTLCYRIPTKKKVQYKLALRVREKLGGQIVKKLYI